MNWTAYHIYAKDVDGGCTEEITLWRDEIDKIKRKFSHPYYTKVWIEEEIISLDD